MRLKFIACTLSILNASSFSSSWLHGVSVQLAVVRRNMQCNPKMLASRLHRLFCRPLIRSPEGIRRFQKDVGGRLEEVGMKTSRGPRRKIFRLLLPPPLWSAIVLQRYGQSISRVVLDCSRYNIDLNFENLICLHAQPNEIRASEDCGGLFSLFYKHIREPRLNSTNREAVPLPNS